MRRSFQRPFTLPRHATEIVLVRHGSTVRPGAADGSALTAGQGDPALEPVGHRQAAAVGARLARSDPPAALFVSGLRRTALTAAPLAAATGLTPTVVPELNEVHLGAWEGGEFERRLAARDPQILRALAEQRWDVLPGGEDMGELATRIARGLADVVDLTGPDAVAVAFVHGGVIAEACRQATGSEPFAFLYAENGSITRLVHLPGGRWRLRGFNDVSHLDEEVLP